MVGMLLNIFPQISSRIASGREAKGDAAYQEMFYKSGSNFLLIFCQRFGGKYGEDNMGDIQSRPGTVFILFINNLFVPIS
jgi:hypothetical protein